MNHKAFRAVVGWRQVLRRVIALLLVLLIARGQNVCAFRSSGLASGSGSIGLGASVCAEGGLSPFLIWKFMRDASQGVFYSQLGEESSKSLYSQLAVLAPTTQASSLPLNMPVRITPFSWESGDPDARHMQVRTTVAAALNAVIPAVLADCPELFWLRDRTRFDVETPADYLVSDSGGVSSLTINTVLLDIKTIAGTPEELADYAVRLEETVETMTGGVAQGSRYEQLSALHTLLLDRLAPAAASDRSPHKELATSLLFGQASSLGYARAFQLLCKRMGIACVTLRSGGDVPAVWCMVRMENDKWYIVDPAYNDQQTGSARTERFLIGTDRYAPNPEPPGFGFSYPEAETADYTSNANEKEVQPASKITANGTLVYGDALGTVSPVGEFVASDGLTAVSGSLEWREPELLPQAGRLVADYRFTPTEPGYLPYSGTAQLWVEQRRILVTPNMGESVYNGSVYPKSEIPYQAETLLPGDVWSGKLALESAEVGAQLVVVGSLDAGENYVLELAETVWTVTQRPLQIEEVLLAEKEYDGDPGVQVESLSLQNLLEGDEVTAQVTARYDTSAAGFNKSAKVTLTGLAGADAGQYSLSAQTVRAIGTVHKYEGAQCPPKTVTITGEAAYGSISLDMLAQPTGPGESGALRYPARPTNVQGGIFQDVPTIQDGTLRYKTHGGLAAGTTAAMTIQVECDNYADMELVLTFFVEHKTQLVGTGVEVSDKTYNGLPITPRGKVLFKKGDQTVEISQPLFTYYGTGRTRHKNPQEPPKDAGEYALIISVPPDNPLYTGSTAPIPFTIREATLQIHPQDKDVLVGDPMPAFTFDYIGFVPGEDESLLSPLPIAQTQMRDTNVRGSALIYISNDPQAKNYKIGRGYGMLTVWDQGMDTSYLRFPEPEHNGWYKSDIVVEPSGKRGFDRVSLSQKGPFLERVVVDTEGTNGILFVYLQNSTGATGHVLFQYKLDKTPAQFTWSCRQRPNQQEAVLLVSARDELSSVEEISCVSENGSLVPFVGEGYPVTDGVYTITVRDRAGNVATQQASVSLRKVDTVRIVTDTGETPPTITDGTTPLTLAVHTTGNATAEDYSCDWSSSDPLVVSVDPSGRVFFRGRGTSTISVRVMDKIATHTLEVALSIPVNTPNNGTTPGIELPKDSMPPGTSEDQLRMVVGPVDNEYLQRIATLVATNQQKFSGMTVDAMSIRLIDAESGSTLAPAGRVAVTVPYPPGTDTESNFTLLHLAQEGVEFPPVTATVTGVRFEAVSLGAFALGYKTVSLPEMGAPGGDMDDAEAAYWLFALDKVERAPEGTGISISLNRYHLVPVSILRAAQGRDITLTFVENARQVSLHGKDLVLSEGVATYSFSQLKKLKEEILARKADEKSSVSESDAKSASKSEKTPVYEPQTPSKTVKVSEVDMGAPAVLKSKKVPVENTVPAPQGTEPPVSLPEGSAEEEAEIFYVPPVTSADRLPETTTGLLLIGVLMAVAVLMVWSAKKNKEADAQTQAEQKPTVNTAVQDEQDEDDDRSAGL